MARFGLAATAAALLMLAGCAGGPGGTGASGLESAVTMRAERELMAADRAFAAMAQERGVAAAWAAYLAPDATLLSAAEPPVVGAQAIVDVMSSMPVSATVDWAPEEALASAAGDFGVTWGDYVVTATAPGGEPIAQGGRYLTAWRKIEGQWRVVLDFGVERED
ncbi:MAG: nuclear transport factor 2 family protein [Maricaulaceae bacterium]|jgi:ketosteroid isomerase-like protein